MTFNVPHSGTLHGFAGYFEAVLYGNIGLSIHPERKDAISKDMLSWFPCFFPIKVSYGCLLVDQAYSVTDIDIGSALSPE